VYFFLASLQTGYAYAELTGLDTSSYTKANVSISIDTDADDKQRLINSVKGSVAIDVQTGSLFQTYVLQGYT